MERRWRHLSLVVTIIAVIQRLRKVPQRVSRYTFALVGLFALVFVLRFATIYPQVGPPSEDLGGDLIVLHTYTEQNPVFPYFKFAAPPLYYLLVIIPVTTVFPTLLGLKIIDALIPTITIFPFYFLSKVIVRDRLASTVASYLFCFCEAFGEMMGWGGTLNLFALTFALTSLYYLTRLIQKHSVRDMLLTALFLSLTVGTHQLTALYTILVFVLVMAASYLPTLGLSHSLRLYAQTIGLSAVFSIPYVPTYLSLAKGSVNLISDGSVSLQSIAGTLVYINARTNPSIFLLTSTALLGFLILVRTTGNRTATIMTLMAGIAAVLIIPLLNATIVGRAAYFLPIPLFLLVAVSSRRIMAFAAGPSLRLKVMGALFIGLIVLGFSIGDFNRLQSATAYNQILNESTLQALDWISLHTVRTDTIFTNYQGLGGWIAGYSQRNVISPRPIGYIVTSPDYAPTVAANAIDAGNYVLDSKLLTIGDFFPSSIINPAVYVNLPTGRQGLLFLDDDYQTIYFGTTTGFHGGENVSALSKNLSNASVEGSHSFTFNYSWEFGTVSRTVSLTPPNSIGISYSISVVNSNETAFVARILAFSGETFAYSRVSENMTRLGALLSDGQAIRMSIGYNGPPGDSIISSFSQDDNITKHQTLSVRLSSHSSTTRLSLSISLLDLSFSDPVSSYNSLNLVRSYSVDYLVLDVQAFSQIIRFEQAGFASVYLKSGISILKVNL
jgi:hypothetical protein